MGGRVGAGGAVNPFGWIRERFDKQDRQLDEQDRRQDEVLDRMKGLENERDARLEKRTHRSTVRQTVTTTVLGSMAGAVVYTLILALSGHIL